jgi:hypothetical protein
MAERPSPFAPVECIVDAMKVVADVVVAQAPCGEYRLGLMAIALAFGFMLLQPRTKPECHRAPESHAARLAEHRERLLDPLSRLRSPARGELDVGELRQQRRFVALCPDRAGELQSALEEGPCLGIAVAEDKQRALGLERKHLGEAIAEPDCECARRFQIGESFVELQQEKTAVTDHHQIGGGGAREFVRIGQLDAAPEPPQRPAHPCLGVIRVSEPARCVQLPERVAYRAREAERRLVLRPARRDVATRELEIAAYVVQLGRLARETLRQRLGFGERRERLLGTR